MFFFIVLNVGKTEHVRKLEEIKQENEIRRLQELNSLCAAHFERRKMAVAGVLKGGSWTQ